MSIKESVLDSATKKEIIDVLSEKLKACYVYSDIAVQIVDRLKKSFDDGEYSDITDGELFALALTLQIQEVNHDEHLWVRWHPDSLPNFEGQLRLDKGWQEQQRLKASLDNFGLYKLERLSGNIGYMDIRYFYRATWGADTINSAMNFLAGMNALIIDLRWCTGGYPDMIALLISYFFEGPPIHLSSIYWRDEDFTQEYWTLSNISGRRFIGKPLYVLVSNITFSAGENFASILQTRQRATLIGEKTDGGAHPGASYRIHSHFEAFIPVGRAFDPLTGQDLEGIGVSPNITLPQEYAFLAAYHLALKNFLGCSNESQLEPYKVIVEEARSAFKNLHSKYKFCSSCGYQNSLFTNQCKNCGEPLPDPASYESLF
jgi:hypothetical protein